jgi:hypothetical protein
MCEGKKSVLLRFFCQNISKRTALFLYLSLILFSSTLISTSSGASIQAKSVSESALADSLVQSSTQLLWERTYGGAGDDRAYCAAATEDGGFLIVGSTGSILKGRTVAWVVNIDANGNMLWNKTFPERDNSEFRHVVKTNDGFLLIGDTSTSTGNYDGLIVKIDDDGNTQWNITIGGPGVNRLLSATTTQDGFEIVGLTFSFNSSSSKAWVIKTSFDGRLVWNRTYSHSGDDAAWDIVPAENGTCVVAGYTNSTENGNYDFWLFKIDEDGVLLWSRTYHISETQEATAIVATEDGYLVVGDITLPAGEVNALMVKTDLNGNLVWARTFGGNDYDSPKNVIHLSSGGYAIAGFTFSFGNGRRDFWLFKIDESGNEVWSCTLGGAGFQEAYYVYEVAESEFVLVGWTNSIGHGLYDFYAVKINVEPRSYGFIARSLVYVLGGVVAIGVLTLVFLRIHFSRRRVKVGSVLQTLQVQPCSMIAIGAVYLKF